MVTHPLLHACRMTRVTGERLTPPTLLYGRGRTFKPPPGTGRWNLRGLEFIEPAKMKSFAVVDLMNANEQSISALLHELSE